MVLAKIIQNKKEKNQTKKKNVCLQISQKFIEHLFLFYFLIYFYFISEYYENVQNRSVKCAFSIKSCLQNMNVVAKDIFLVVHQY